MAKQVEVAAVAADAFRDQFLLTEIEMVDLRVTLSRSLTRTSVCPSASRSQTRSQDAAVLLSVSQILVREIP